MSRHSYCTMEQGCPLVRGCQKRFFPHWDSICIRARDVVFQAEEARRDAVLDQHRAELARAAGLPPQPREALQDRPDLCGPVPDWVRAMVRGLAARGQPATLAPDAQVERRQDDAGRTIEYVRLTSGRRLVLRFVAAEPA